ncbi:HNH endonuclease family protein [Nonomuraea sp. M3C6]|uniref:HNH endonuclease family protein n=1 Tax=Nonomuraea marmarensis TaxID=3351344 RepID=A0ABW7ADJ3_9ACTN
MLSLRTWHPHAATAAAATFLVLVPGAATASPAEPPPALSAKAADAQLSELTIAEPRPMRGYSRSRFPHWEGQGHSCDTRELVLARDGEDVKQDEKCRAIAGTWHSPYDGKDFDRATQLDIDHMVPLAEAWRSGADTWTDTRRRQFANDLDGPQLIAVSAESNRSKGDQAPGEWRPPLRTYWCDYGRAWIDVKSRYHLTVTQPERDALAEMIGTCGQQEDRQADKQDDKQDDKQNDGG